MPWTCANNYDFYAMVFYTCCDIAINCHLKNKVAIMLGQLETVKMETGNG